MPRGQRPNVERRLQVSKLRAQGLSYRLIGQILGVTRQCVHALLRSTDPEGLTYIACCVCGVKITRWRGPRPDPVFCPSCLPADAALAQKIRSYRVALGLTWSALAERTGMSVGSIIAYERGQRPGPRNGAKLSRVLGVEDRMLGEVRKKIFRPAFTMEQILRWAQAHHERTNEWPKIHSGAIPESPGDNWRRVDNALKLGLRGLPGGSSLAKLLGLQRTESRFCLT
jgi:transcriptional regulator with XRE-family HTH domain